MYFHFFEGRCYNLVHIIVAVFRKPSTKNDVRLVGSKGLVLIEYPRVFIIIHRVIRLRSLHPFLRVLVRDHGFGLCAELEMFMLDNARERRFAVGIVHHCISLIVLLIQQLVIEAQAAVFELAEAEVEILVDRTRYRRWFLRGQQVIPFL
jgi:hypothetical protein